MGDTNCDPVKVFEEEKRETVLGYSQDHALRAASSAWLEHALRKRYVYNFSFLGRPIIQLPTDIVAFQEIVWDVRPDLIIEMGIAHGGSLILSASMLALLDYCDAVTQETLVDPQKPKRRVLGVDIDIRAHNLAAIKNHPMAGRIDMIEGSSVAPDVIRQVKSAAAKYSRVLVCLDSNHTHDHVLAELEAYAPLTTMGSYCIVFDTVVEDMPDDMYPDRPWGKGNNPKTAVREYLKRLGRASVNGADGNPLHFAVDHNIEGKLLLTVTPEGFLKRV